MTNKQKQKWKQIEAKKKCILSKIIAEDDEEARVDGQRRWKKGENETREDCFQAKRNSKMASFKLHN